jgi:hypothetical protein
MADAPGQLTLSKPGLLLFVSDGAVAACLCQCCVEHMHVEDDAALVRAPSSGSPDMDNR